MPVIGVVVVVAVVNVFAVVVIVAALVVVIIFVVVAVIVIADATIVIAVVVVAVITVVVVVIAVVVVVVISSHRSRPRQKNGTDDKSVCFCLSCFFLGCVKKAALIFFWLRREAMMEKINKAEYFNLGDGFIF